MKNLKLISVRVDEEALNVIDRHCLEDRIWPRSWYISGAVRLMAWLIEHGKANYVAEFYPEFGDVVDEFEFKYHRSHK